MSTAFLRLLPVALALLALPSAALAESAAESPCPTVVFDKVPVGDAINITANNTTPAIDIKHYHWRTNAGKIISGQHTARILLYSPQENPTVTLDITGKFPYTCSHTIQETLH